MRIPQRTTGTTALSAILLLLPQFCLAAAGAQGLSAFVQSHIITQALYAFGGIAGAAIFYYAVRIIIESHKESALTDLNNSFINAFIGFLILTMAMAFTNAFTSPIPQPTLLIPGLNTAGLFIIQASAGVFTLMIVLAGIRMITSEGDQGHFDKWRKVLVGNIIGVMIMMIGNYSLAFYSVAGRNGAGPDPSFIINEMKGLANFLLTIVGFSCVIAGIIAGIFLIVSIDESLRDRAKKAIIGTLIALAIVISVYTLMITFV